MLFGSLYKMKASRGTSLSFKQFGARPMAHIKVSYLACVLVQYKETWFWFHYKVWMLKMTPNFISMHREFSFRNIAHIQA